MHGGTRSMLWLLLAVFLALPAVITADQTGQQSIATSQINLRLHQVLSQQGYLGRFRNGQDLQRGTSAYLWDHRHWLRSVDFHNARQGDVLVCLLVKQNFAGFEQLTADPEFIRRCTLWLK